MPSLDDICSLSGFLLGTFIDSHDSSYVGGRKVGVLGEIIRHGKATKNEKDSNVPSRYAHLVLLIVIR